MVDYKVFVVEEQLVVDIEVVVDIEDIVDICEQDMSIIENTLNYIDI